MAAPLRNVLINGLFGVRSAAQKVAYSPYCALHSSARMQSEETATFEFDEKMLEYLVCPLSKKPLRYDKNSQQLICDELQVAYPIVNGIPNLVPTDGKPLSGGSGATETSQASSS